jgi:hypothetical protein
MANAGPSLKPPRAPKLSGWVPLFPAGIRKGEPYTAADIDDLVRNYHAFKGVVDPPAVIGHGEAQPWLADSGLPAAGWVADARKNGDTLEVRFAHMPPRIKRLIKRRAYDKVSAEIYHEDRLPEGIPAKGKMLRRVAFLGGELPHVKGLGSLEALWDEPDFDDGEDAAQFAEWGAGGLVYAGRQELPGGTWEVFFECPCGSHAVDRKALEKQLADAGYSEAAIKNLAALPDDDFSAVAADALKVAANAAKITALVTPPPPPIAPPVPPPPVATPLPANFSELIQTEAQKQVAAMLDPLRREAQAIQANVGAVKTQQEQQARASHDKLVRTYAEKLENKFPPSMLEFAKDGKPLGSVAHALYHADGVAKFGEAESALESQFKKFSEGPDMTRFFAEKIAQPGEGSGEEARAVKEAAEYAERRNKKAG